MMALNQRGISCFTAITEHQEGMLIRLANFFVDVNMEMSQLVFKGGQIGEALTHIIGDERHWELEESTKERLCRKRFHEEDGVETEGRQDVGVGEDERKAVWARGTTCIHTHTHTHRLESTQLVRYVCVFVHASSLIQATTGERICSSVRLSPTRMEMLIY